MTAENSALPSLENIIIIIIIILKLKYKKQ